MRFTIGDQVYQFCAICFGLAPAPFVFTKILRSLAEYLRKEGILIIYFYVNDWLIWAKCKHLLRSQAQQVMSSACKLDIIINLAKSNLIPQSWFVHLGIDFDLVQGLAFPTQESLNKTRLWSKYLHQYMKATAKAYLSFLGLLNHGSFRQATSASSPILPQIFLESAQGLPECKNTVRSNVFPSPCLVGKPRQSNSGSHIIPNE